MNTTTTHLVYDCAHIDQAAQLLCHHMPQAQVFTFTGTLGAGKTTLIQRFLSMAGVTEGVTSPTFTYVNIYTTKQGQTFYHFDCYRLQSLHEFIASGFHEYLYAPNSWSLIEWPEIVMPLLTHNVCHITLDYAPDNKR